MRVVAKHRDDRLQSLDLLQTANEKKIWPRVRRDVELVWRIIAGRHEVRENLDLSNKSPLVVHVASEAAWREEHVNGVRALVEELRVSPPLRRSSEFQCTAETLRLLAESLVVFPKNVHRAHQPMLMH